MLGEVVLVSSLPDYFFCQQSIPEKIPRKDTELTQTYDKSNPQKNKTQINKIRTQKANKIRFKADFLKLRMNLYAKTF